MEIKDTIKKLAEWYATPLGKSLREEEKLHLGTVLTDFFGDYLLLAGVYLDIFSLGNKDNKVQSEIYLSQDGSLGNSRAICIFGKAEELPFYNDSIDIIVFNHLLEFIEKPHLVLEEAFHTLVPNGKLIILGFNPFSLFGMLSFINKNKQKVTPWNGRYINSWRLRSWLLQIGFAIKSYETFSFKLPVQNTALLKNSSFLEKIGKFVFPYFGECYILVAEKELLNLKPLREQEVKKQMPLAVRGVGATFTTANIRKEE